MKSFRFKLFVLVVAVCFAVGYVVGCGSSSGDCAERDNRGDQDCA